MNTSASNPSQTQINELLDKLSKITKDNEILDKQLRQSRRDYGDALLREKEIADVLTESRLESAELRAKLNRLNSDNETATRELRFELKQLKHRFSEANEELLEMRKKYEAAAALEAENWVLRGVAEAAKAAEEKAVKDKEQVVTENMDLKRAKDSIMESATVRFRAFEKRVRALEVCVANIKHPVDSSSGQAAPVRVQETMDHAVVYLDSD